MQDFSDLSSFLAKKDSNKRLSFDEKCAKFLYRKLGYTKDNLIQLKNSNQLSCSTINADNLLPFEIWAQPVKIKGWSELILKLPKSELYQTWLQTKSSSSSVSALIFAHSSKHGKWVIHNAANLSQTTSTTRLVHKVGDNQGIVIEPLEALLAAILQK